jgi:hypothetical protein
VTVTARALLLGLVIAIPAATPVAAQPALASPEISAGVSVTPARGLTASLTQYFFWRVSDRDAVYNAAGAVLRPGMGTDARYIGAELDLLVNYQITRHILAYVGYSHFFAGEFLEQSGRGRDSDFFYGAVQYTF